MPAHFSKGECSGLLKNARSEPEGSRSLERLIVLAGTPIHKINQTCTWAESGSTCSARCASTKRLLPPSDLHQIQGVFRVSGIRVQLDRTFQLPFGASPVPVRIHERQSK